ncbi:thioesterase II family protein [Clostridium beijerinckii]|uniref:thioesterase II family protein n=1 Tax=Clostridium beijerinckii TaxID=1520 RepID=UPI0003D36D9B|nr:thioesterase domain-containing protein [Clostridium beijerinckii]ALB45160.1 thioesterase [Clostridium beijerinckii NRRL B-598]
MLDKWIKYECKREKHRCRIFCFPYAGGSAIFYSKWFKYLEEDIEICPVQLPGRENRIGEEVITDINILVKEIVEAIKPLLDETCAFMGHSMGGLISYEVARYVSRKKIATPKAVFISGTVPPDIIKSSEKIHEISDKEFCEKIEGYDNINKEMFKYKEFYKYFLPTLRGDFKLVETYEIDKIEKLSCKMFVMGGDKDDFVPISSLKQWERYAEDPVEVKIFEGNHFYIKEHVQEICRIMNENI